MSIKRKTMRHSFFLLSLLPLFFAACSPAGGLSQKSEKTATMINEPNTNESEKDTVIRTDEEWKSILSELEYQVTRNKGTERAFTGPYWNSKEKGIYLCVCCGNELFESKTKFDSGTGWPSFYDAFEKRKIKEKIDQTHGMVRTEVMCNRCGAHLGHLFPDGPEPTGLRYCINGASLKFIKEE